MKKKSRSPLGPMWKLSARAWACAIPAERLALCGGRGGAVCGIPDAGALRVRFTENRARLGGLTVHTAGITLTQRASNAIDSAARLVYAVGLIRVPPAVNRPLAAPVLAAAWTGTAARRRERRSVVVSSTFTHVEIDMLY
ncbi:unnamed protein product, partial [Iphiclides podalirius]